jgi:Na+-driven multidrug efflux pump
VASVLANAANFILDVVLMFGLGFGAGGAALATTVSQYISCFVLYRMLVKKDMLRVSDVMRPPSMARLMPVLKVNMPSLPGAFSNFLCSGMCVAIIVEALCFFAKAGDVSVYECVIAILDVEKMTMSLGTIDWEWRRTTSAVKGYELSLFIIAQGKGSIL